MTDPRLARLARAALLLGAVLTAVYAVLRETLDGATAITVLDEGVYNAVLGIAVALILARALCERRERLAWAALGLGLLSWTAANVHYSTYVAHLDPIPIPSAADALWLAFYPPAYLAVILLVRARVSGLRRGLWLDGVIAALAVGALAAAVLVGAIGAIDTDGPAAEIATNLAYPSGDLILVAVVTFALAIGGWRGDRTWALLGAGLVVFTVSDMVYLVMVARDEYGLGALIDSGWLIASLLFASAAVRPSPERRAGAGDGRRLLIVPCAFGALGLGMLVWGNLRGIDVPALALATLCVLAVIARMALTFAQSHRESLTDSLTGLPNRRRLTRDLRDRAPVARVDRPLGLVFFDLNGFKGYNDRFGHPAGDALLARLSGRLSGALGTQGTAYRMGGDEFCALLREGEASIDTLVSRALSALTDSGEGFAIDAAHGLVRLPLDVRDAEGALRLADQRMYALKLGGRVPTERQTTDVLLQVLSERDPELGDHSDGVAELAQATGARMGLSEHDRDEIALAARLHDIGKAAVPDAILRKPGPLTHDERAIMNRHPAIGERILRAAPSLQGVAGMVRASHERVDGAGYPDRLAGEGIPLGARIVAVCDAFDAIIADRPYAAARTPAEAVAELHRSAGTQFDPAVVAAFTAVLADRARRPEGIAVTLR